MTKTQVSTGDRDASMSPEAQRIAIEEVCQGVIFIWPDGRQQWRSPAGIYHDCVNNDILQDLNALHEAEKVLTPAQHGRFIGELSGYHKPPEHGSSFHLNRRQPSSGFWYGDMWKVAHVTAVQRAEAFLRTFNLWKPDQSEKRDL